MEAAEAEANTLPAAAAAAAAAGALERKRLLRKKKRRLRRLRQRRMEAMQRQQQMAEVTTSEAEDVRDSDRGADSTEEKDLQPLRPKQPPPSSAAAAAVRQAAAAAKEPLKEALYEEDIVDGFSFVAFNNYEDLEVNFNHTTF